MKFLITYEDVDFSKHTLLVDAATEELAIEKFKAFEMKHSRNFHEIAVFNLDKIPHLTDDYQLSIKNYSL
ncbi:hypothetical protein UA32_12515 [Photobacterium angustum]|uniref:Uncharacterized protein n=1 Tax=Photobacterium angustum TaxID=661 RepID=A0ABX5H124_PHOAN|nr:hypothetical protein [Photobacterium angustum]KJG37770.1 hypothetical protein UA32_12515 [Photobacterium angustum]PSX07037.1 hypothetical protein C0W27_15830 [Photobacterium angustum]